MRATRRNIRSLMTLTLLAAGWVQLATGCRPVRDSVVLSCDGNQQCPADGYWYCDLTTHLCQHCTGSCPVVSIPDMDAGPALSDAVTQSADTQDTGMDADAGPLGCDSGLPVPDGIGQEGPSCYNKCGGKGGIDPSTSKECWCDSACEANGDCCFDYEARCGCLAATEPAKTCDLRCGDRSDNAACQCDTLCSSLGDCCDDFFTICASCTAYCDQSGGLGTGDNTCYCDETCKVQSDCCYDYDDLCVLGAN